MRSHFPPAAKRRRSYYRVRAPHCELGNFRLPRAKMVVAYYRAVPRLSFPKIRKSDTPAWLTQVADHRAPNGVSGFLEFFRERERGSFLFFKGLQKPLSAQIQRN